MGVWALSCDWESYPWKNDLAEQLSRVEAHFAEALDENFIGQHNPLHMLERAVVLAAFSVRRLIEKRLVTDRLASRSVSVCCFMASSEFRHPMHGSSGGEVFTNYDFNSKASVTLSMAKLASEIIHASQLLVLSGDCGVPTGLLVASDFGLKKRLLHLTMEEFRGYVHAILDDRIRLRSDTWNPITGEIIATRE